MIVLSLFQMNQSLIKSNSSYKYPYEYHSHASLLVELGFQPLAIAERLGHEKIVTTLNTYSHLYPNKQAELADRLELENGEDNL